MNDVPDSCHDCDDMEYRLNRVLEKLKETADEVVTLRLVINHIERSLDVEPTEWKSVWE